MLRLAAPRGHRFSWCEWAWRSVLKAMPARFDQGVCTLAVPVAITAAGFREFSDGPFDAFAVLQIDGVALSRLLLQAGDEPLRVVHPVRNRPEEQHHVRREQAQSLRASARQTSRGPYVKPACLQRCHRVGIDRQTIAVGQADEVSRQQGRQLPSFLTNFEIARPFHVRGADADLESRQRHRARSGTAAACFHGGIDREARRRFLRAASANNARREQ